MISGDIIRKYIDNTATASEIVKVETWRDRSLDNELKFQKYQEHIVIGAVDPPSSESPRGSSVKRNRYILLVAVALILSYIIAYVSMSQRQFTEKVAMEEAIDIQLTEGSNIHLRKNSRLVYPEQFSYGFRKVTLDGSAVFNVRNQEIPFVVQIGDGKVAVDVFPAKFSIVELPSGSILIESLLGRLDFSVDMNNEKIPAGTTCVWDQKSGSVQVGISSGKHEE
jgi:ferric-dicitrate binding protein FerR (iron transport regulator)